MHGVKIGIGKIPEFYRTKIIEVNPMHHGLRCSFSAGKAKRTFGNDFITFAKIDFDRTRFLGGFQRHQEEIDIQRRVRTKRVFGLGEDIFDESAGDDAQGDFAVDAAEGQVVNLVSERRNVGTFARIDIDSQNIFAVEIEMRGEIKGEWSIATFVFAETNTVNPHGRGGHDPFKIHEDVFAFGFRGQAETSAIERDELVRLVVKAVPGETHVGVRNDDAVEGGVI